MNKIIAICGMIMLGTTATPNYQESFTEAGPMHDVIGVPGHHVTVFDNCITCNEGLDLDKIVYLSTESPFDLGFDTADYLPEGFDPYEVYVDLDAIAFIEGGEETDLGFDTAYWLPAGFDPYASPTSIDGISYMEDETSLIFPELDTKAYLPQHFDPYAKANTLRTDEGSTERPEAR